MTRSKHIRIAMSAAAAVAVASAGIAGATAATASPAHRASGKVAFVIGGSGSHETVVMHGAIVAGGKDDASHNNYDVFQLGNGTIRVTHPTKKSTFTPKINQKTCYGTFTITGPWTMGRGTGAYKGVTGKGTYKALGTVVLKRTKSGACNMKAQPKAEVFVVHGSGHVST